MRRYVLIRTLSILPTLLGLSVAVFVLKYPLPREKDSPYKLPEQPLQDGQRSPRCARPSRERLLRRLVSLQSGRWPL